MGAGETALKANPAPDLPPKIEWVSNFLGAVHPVGASLPRDLLIVEKIARQTLIFYKVLPKLAQIFLVIGRWQFTG